MIRVHIANMTCGGCAKGVTATLKAVDPAIAPRIDLDARTVEIPGTAATPAQLLAALAEDGWEGKALGA